MQQSYFTPAIEDIRVGYECEWERNGSWESFAVKDWDEFEQLDLDRMRTPYLSKEQIQAEGWKDFQHSTETWLVKDNWTCILYSNGIQLSYVGNIKYSGNCPSINEFRFLQKLFGI